MPQSRSGGRSKRSPSGADQPILVGLRYILDNGLRVERASGETPPAWAIAAARGMGAGE